MLHNLDAQALALNDMAATIHELNEKWWRDLETGQPIERNVGELLCLIHSEISEGLEAHRKDLMDDKLPHRKGLEVELADALIRILDLAGAHGMDIGGAYAEKCRFNMEREDHKHEARRAAGGKKF
jgi:NTP pyrophosphatase (non-canonical NTP hydrolase)